MGWAGFLRKTWPNYVSPMGRVIEVTTRPWVTHGPGWAGLWAGLMRPIPGPKVAAATYLYQTYYSLIGGSRYYIQIGKLHEKYGKVQTGNGSRKAVYANGLYLGRRTCCTNHA